MRTRSLFVLALLALAALTPADDSNVDSIYTDLAEPPCDVVFEDDETGSVTLRCEGPEDYALLLHDGDARMSVTVVTPDGQEHDLNYWSVVTRAFSALGPKAEWRFRSKEGSLLPNAIIVRVNAYEDPENPDKITSYLAVAKIDDSGICVTDRVPPVAEQNVRARELADASAGKPCLPELP